MQWVIGGVSPPPASSSEGRQMQDLQGPSSQVERTCVIMVGEKVCFTWAPRFHHCSCYCCFISIAAVIVVAASVVVVIVVAAAIVIVVAATTVVIVLATVFIAVAAVIIVTVVAPVVAAIVIVGATVAATSAVHGGNLAIFALTHFRTN